MVYFATSRSAFYLHAPLSKQCHPFPPPFIAAIQIRPNLQFFDKEKPISVFLSKPPVKISQFGSNCVNVSNEDRSVVSENKLSSASESPLPPPPQNARLEEEKFVILKTGIFDCRSCGFCYDKATGDPSYPIPAGLEFEKLPADWRCPTCGVGKSFFVGKSVEIAGFAQNQQFGLGGNTLTSAQKAFLIYGSLFLFFLLFLSGYFLP